MYFNEIKCHENCAHYQNGFCRLNRIKVDPKGPICPRSTPKYREIDSKSKYIKSIELKILEEKLDDIQRRIRFLKGKITDSK